MLSIRSVLILGVLFVKKIQCGGMFYNVYLAYNIVFETIKHLNIYKVYQRRTYGVRVLRAPTHTYTSADIPFKPHTPTSNFI